MPTKREPMGVKDEVRYALDQPEDGGEVTVGNELSPDLEGWDGPSEDQWPAEGRDKRLAVNKVADPKDFPQDGHLFPDPAQHPDRPWVSKKITDPDAIVVTEED